MSDFRNTIQQEHDACGVGFVYKPERTRSTIDDALTALAQMEHRGATGWDGVTGDGAGIMAAIPKEIFRKEVTVATLWLFYLSPINWQEREAPS